MPLHIVRPRLGYVPDQPDDRDLPLGAPLGAAPRARSLRPYVLNVFDQLTTESCVAQALVQAIRTQQGTLGRVEPTYSRLSVYWHARARKDALVRDGGCRIPAAIKGLRELGAPDESVWPFDVAWVNKRPSWLAEKQGFDRRGVRGYYRVLSVDGMRSAIADGRPVVAGWQVDEAFLDSNGPHLVESFGAPIGGHAMCVVGYDEHGFEVVNSWGRGWRDGGFCRLSNAAAGAAIDAWAIDVGD